MRSLTIFTAAVALAFTALAKPPVPRPAKEFDFVDANGKHTLLSSYRGKVVVIQFLQTTCPHCQAMSQMLTKLNAELGPRGFQPIGVAFNDATPDMFRNYVSQFHIGMPVAYAPRDTVISYLGLSIMDRFVVPQVMVIDKKGTIVAQSDPLGTAELQTESYLRDMVDKLLKEGATSSSTKKAVRAVATAKKAGSGQ